MSQQEENYKQCYLFSEEVDNVHQFQIAWMPVKFAIVGKVVTLQDLDLKWQILEVYPPIMTREQLDALRRTDKDFQYILSDENWTTQPFSKK